MTYLQLVNAVLRRLREDEVVSYNETAYSKLIGDFINESKREVEDAWNWGQLRSTIQVTCVPSTWRYTLTGAGNRYRILQVLNDTQDFEVKKAPYKWLNSQFTGSSPSNGNPAFYDVNGNSDGDPNVDLYPIPNVADVVNFNMVIPQGDFTESDTVLTVPSYPVILGAHAKALSERGEDGSTMFAEVMSNYNKALSDAISIDSANLQDELIWELV